MYILIHEKLINSYHGLCDESSSMQSPLPRVSNTMSMVSPRAVQRVCSYSICRYN